MQKKSVFVNYQSVGWYQVREARKLLRKLETSPIRFRVESNRSGPRMRPTAAARGGKFGQNRSINILIHPADTSEFLMMREKVLIPTPVLSPKRKTFLQMIRDFGRHEID